MGVVLGAHPVRGESHIQTKAKGKVATGVTRGLSQPALNTVLLQHFQSFSRGTLLYAFYWSTKYEETALVYYQDVSKIFWKVNV